MDTRYKLTLLNMKQLQYIYIKIFVTKSLILYKLNIIKELLLPLENITYKMTFPHAKYSQKLCDELHKNLLTNNKKSKKYLNFF